jgi:hypothetical protein
MRTQRHLLPSFHPVMTLDQLHPLVLRIKTLEVLVQKAVAPRLGNSSQSLPQFGNLTAELV